MSVLRRNASDRFSEVVPEWGGYAAVVLAGGPSLTQDQVALVRREREAGSVRAIAVNDAYLLAPWADVNYFADSEWWEWQTKGVPKSLLKLTADQVRERFAAFQGQKCSIQNSGANIKDDAVHMLRNKAYPANHSFGLSLDTGALVSGRNSGFQALNLAILAGAKKVLLLGFDGRSGVDGKGHWFGEHPRPSPTEPFYEAMRRGFSAAEGDIRAAGVTVLNCSSGSAIDSFPKMPIEQALAS